MSFLRSHIFLEQNIELIHGILISDEDIVHRYRQMTAQHLMGFYGGKCWIQIRIRIQFQIQRQICQRYNSLFEDMGKEGKSQIMGKVYREFSRQKYNKYKTQFPKLRESDIVGKIIKEWDALDQVAKDNLRKTFESKNYLTNEDISSSEALVRGDVASKELKIAAEKAAKRPIKSSRTEPTRFHTNVRPSSRDVSEAKGSEQKDDSRLGESSSLQILQKTKPISKPTTQHNYIDFYKHYYKKLSSEHRRWTTSQITKVIKLLWKKSKHPKKTLKRAIGLRSLKPISARRFFRKSKRLSAFEANLLWKRLPYESKKQYERKGKGDDSHIGYVSRLVKFGSSQGLTASTNVVKNILSKVH